MERANGCQWHIRPVPCLADSFRNPMDSLDVSPRWCFHFGLRPQHFQEGQSEVGEMEPMPRPKG
jgi:hypothetical protein